jgi:ribosomal small subunit protein bTHX
MGKGDRKTKKGKIWAGTYGARRRRSKPVAMEVRDKAKPATGKKAKSEK